MKPPDPVKFNQMSKPQPYKCLWVLSRLLAMFFLSVLIPSSPHWGHVIIPKPRTNAMKRTVMYRAMFQWNKLPYFIIQAASKERFKKHLKRLFLGRGRQNI